MDPDRNKGCDGDYSRPNPNYNHNHPYASPRGYSHYSRTPHDRHQPPRMPRAQTVGSLINYGARNAEILARLEREEAEAEAATPQQPEAHQQAPRSSSAKTLERSVSEEGEVRVNATATPSSSSTTKPKDASICENCGRKGHRLSRCIKLDPEFGDIAGCPMCETTSHSFDDCPHLPHMKSDDIFEYLVIRRAGRGPIRTKTHDWLEYVGDRPEQHRYPWSRRFAQEWQRSHPVYWERHGYHSLPSWLGVAIDPRTATKPTILEADAARLGPQVHGRGEEVWRLDGFGGLAHCGQEKKKTEQLERRPEKREREIADVQLTSQQKGHQQQQHRITVNEHGSPRRGYDNRGRDHWERESFQGVDDGGRRRFNRSRSPLSRGYAHTYAYDERRDWRWSPDHAAAAAGAARSQYWNRSDYLQDTTASGGRVGRSRSPRLRGYIPDERGGRHGLLLDPAAVAAAFTSRGQYRDLEPFNQEGGRRRRSRSPPLRGYYAPEGERRDDRPAAHRQGQGQGQGQHVSSSRRSGSPPRGLRGWNTPRQQPRERDGRGSRW
ncbi:hypothetical protein QBC44DRAFT_395789 [Cladorrhinum sp. PSN332]|nr:hypothetical protein QBC44DRAFT_395789 [Cladorrhinum sp. PSN332]